MKPETFVVVDGYDKSKNPRTLTVRKFTIEDIRAMLLVNAAREYISLDRHGKARNIRVNGNLKTWKRDTSRFERSFKYGMYEYFRLNTQGMLNTLVVEVVE